MIKRVSLLLSQPLRREIGSTMNSDLRISFARASRVPGDIIAQGVDDLSYSTHFPYTVHNQVHLGRVHCSGVGAFKKSLEQWLNRAERMTSFLCIASECSKYKYLKLAGGDEFNGFVVVEICLYEKSYKTPFVLVSIAVRGRSAEIQGIEVLC